MTGKFYLFSQWLKNHRIEISIFFLAFGTRFLYAVLVQIFFGSHGFIAYKDAEVLYLGGANNFLEHSVFSINSFPPYLPDVYRTPLYTFFVASFLWLKLPFFGIIATQNFLAGIISILVYRIGQLLFSSKRVGLLAAVATSLEPLSIYWNNLLMSDYLFTFFFILGCYKLFQKNYPVFGLLLGLATLVRPIGLYFFWILLLAAIINEFWGQGNLFKLSWRKFLLAMILFIIVLFPWMARNKILFDTWQLSSAFWYNLYLRPMNEFVQTQGFSLPMPIAPSDYPNPETFIYSFQSVAFYKQQFMEIFKKYPLQYSQFHLGLSVKSLLANQYNYLANYVLRPELPALFYGGRNKLIMAAVAIGGLAWSLLYLLMFLSFLHRSSRVFLAAFLVILALVALSLGVLGGGKDADMSRYLLPLAPFVFLFAGSGIKDFYLRLKRTAAGN
ncbi:MAG: hypothetical protein A3I89_01275 [Candidatus Harrisonbacteria bacterium RIFCSPLOWO2_02_FULL_41_11]|uniref:Glycosyltransferase RgtA/B/C/D-like domain-containing protein n=1 Tax=Candidatus Harrisonbacteria bacterium RIFCSPHIGHO2_02_FULL_42_16 TaxID=1798404 RepID=A0A1G1ZI86_9BACT|nr:MAG: hypothetical protein A3B92_00765 [Candidatus Harrisonbacteria bacterium RIFCSPHIGHO2_02_FULL_42_16]OGY67602.1 MAG: hypothetical protein A3I89_01275 [Candidatus Harrisonbacteria bacterium RIFCSPLOWO2_02_FULL_41_11]